MKDIENPLCQKLMTLFLSQNVFISLMRDVLDVFDRLHPNKSFKTVLIPVIFFSFFSFLQIPENHCLCCLLVSENTETFSFHFQAPAANILII